MEAALAQSIAGQAQGTRRLILALFRKKLAESTFTVAKLLTLCYFL